MPRAGSRPATNEPEPGALGTRGSSARCRTLSQCPSGQRTRTLYTDRFLRNRRGVSLTDAERAALEASVSEVTTFDARRTVVRALEPVSRSTLLVEGFMCRYIDDSEGLRQLVAVHVPGEFVDLHGYPLKYLEHDVATLTPAKVANVPHDAIDALIEAHPDMARKLWFSTMVDSAMHRAWIFRLGRLPAISRLAHFLSEINARLEAIGLSENGRFALGMTQVDLAEACGLTNVHINRVIRQLREANLCAFRSSLVHIHDPIGLARLGQFDADYLYLDPSAIEVAKAREGTEAL